MKKILTVFFLILTICLIFTEITPATVIESEPVQDRYFSKNGEVVFIRYAELINFPGGYLQNLSREEFREQADDKNTFSMLVVCLSFSKPMISTKRRWNPRTFRLIEKGGQEMRPLSWQQFGNELNEIISDTSVNEIMLYFEAPEQMNNNFILEINGADLGIGDQIALRLSSHNIRVIQDVAKPTRPVYDDMKILSPQDGQKVIPGEQVDLQLEFTDKVLPPDRILVLSPRYTFEDNYANRLYKINVPAEETSGNFTIVVIAVWQQYTEPITISQSVGLNVISPKLLQ